MTGDPQNPGVYARQPDGQVVQVHAYREGDYELSDIAELFGLGDPGLTEDGRPVLALSGSDLRQLKSMAHAYSFDHEEGLIELCLDLCRFAAQAGPGDCRFWADP